MERLDKRLANTGRWSRREAQELIRGGQVTVDGAVVTAPDAKCPDEAPVAVGGSLIEAGYVYLMLHKPQGVVTATQDRRERTVLELLPPEYRRRGLFPVGRLDKDTEGLLLITDDGPLAHRLLAPKKHVDKTYRVTVDGTLTREDVGRLAAGLKLGDGLECLPAVLELTDAPSVGLLTIQEGKYHQVKRMMAALGKPVTALKRLTMGPLTLDPGLAPGDWRALTEEEVENLKGCGPTKG